MAEGKATVAVRVLDYKTLSSEVTLDRSEAKKLDLAAEFADTVASGTITDAKTGLVVSDAKVIVTDRNGVTTETTTDTNGKWAVEMTRSAIWTEGELSVAMSATRLVRRTASAEIAHGDTVNLEQTLEFQSREVGGTVTDGTNEAIAGAAVELTDNAGTTLTVVSDDHGAFLVSDDFSKQFEVGAAEVTVEASGFTTQVLGIVLSDDNAMQANNDLQLSAESVEEVTDNTPEEVTENTPTEAAEAPTTQEVEASLGEAPEELAFTGSQSKNLFAAGLSLILAGLAMVTRRRPTSKA